MDKVRYFLKTFSGLEWSGPAWYSHDKDKDGFPTNIKLEYFHPLDLGTASMTDWDGGDLMKIYKELRKQFPKIGKEWIQGNIHSHHGMGAFFSGTDVEQCVDGANENFYYSLVVSTKPDKELYFGMSYPDQFGRIHVEEGLEIAVEEELLSNPIWEQQATIIKTNKPTQPLNYRGAKSIGQSSLFLQSENQIEEEQSDRYETHMDMLSYNYIPQSEMGEPAMTWEQYQDYDTLALDYEKGRITKKKFQKKLRKLGVDENGFPILTK